MLHIVEAGETLSRIAARHGTSVSAIVALNPQIDDIHLIRPGDVFRIPGPGEPAPPATYTVRSGDSIRVIARHFGVSTAALVSANPQLADPDLIRPGQVLSLPAGAAPAEGVTPVTGHRRAPWLAIAEREMSTGVDEAAGDGDNPRIVEYHATTTLPASLADEDETPWCSSFVNWCVTEAGLRGTDSALARSWLEWGRTLDGPRRGAVTVFRRQVAGMPNAGHVAFYWATSGDRYLVLGGNQDDQVSIKGYPRTDLLGFRWAA